MDCLAQDQHTFGVAKAPIDLAVLEIANVAAQRPDQLGLQVRDCPLAHLRQTVEAGETGIAFPWGSRHERRKGLGAGFDHIVRVGVGQCLHVTSTAIFTTPERQRASLPTDPLNSAPQRSWPSHHARTLDYQTVSVNSHRLPASHRSPSPCRSGFDATQRGQERTD